MQRYAFLASSPPPLYIQVEYPSQEGHPTTCLPHDSPPSISSSKKGAVRQPLSRSKNQPVLVTHPTSTTSRGDQYCFLLVTSTGPIADQYWSPPLSPTASVADTRGRCYRPILVIGLTYIGLRRDLYWSEERSIQVSPMTNIGSHHPLLLDSHI